MGRVDEVGQLQRSLLKTKSYIETITEQAEKIARREFDDQVLDERKHREQRLEVFNRVLRHNLRNQLDVINSHTERLAEHATDCWSEPVQRHR